MTISRLAEDVGGSEKLLVHRRKQPNFIGVYCIPAVWCQPFHNLNVHTNILASIMLFSFQEKDKVAAEERGSESKVQKRPLPASVCYVSLLA